ncbi:hypothetical protein DC522_12520 [Microvirga sp. KLBC 81]|uniref:hypothetical protein n=1 Tax=Microvirga sp. KLBC 81 TaxID=1862707 RepID=UPI000D512502|nr:hypothetical protein [Microvirga sp. KLBC 81]PVE24108.1 hypothetical protein DC522_12520 [Microvirga sp. KLBC 81]
MVARLVAKRRGERTCSGKLVKPSTVNRTVVEPLRRVMNRAALIWREPMPQINWKIHRLKEDSERVRELRAEEEQDLFTHLREDYHPIVRFTLLTGCRLDECVSLT